MNLVTWSFPTTIVFGAGAVGTVAAHVKRIAPGGVPPKVLIVADPGVVRAGIVTKVKGLLGEAGVGVEVFDAVDPNPVEKNVMDGVAAYKAAGANVIVSVGGGSPLDTGKLIALKATHERPLVDYDDATGGDQFITACVPPIVTIPTTAGLGAKWGGPAS